MNHHLANSQIYNLIGNLIYKGEMVNVVVSDKGIIFFLIGEKYYDNFKNGIFFLKKDSHLEGLR